jgi:hypothetical protein
MGYKGVIHKRHVLGWRNAAERLAVQMDAEAADHLGRLFNVAKPW